MKIAMLSPIAWRTPPRHYGPWEWVVSVLTEGLIKRGVDVTLFATQDSITSGKLEAICPRPYEEDSSLDPKVREGLHIAHLFEKAEQFKFNHDQMIEAYLQVYQHIIDRKKREEKFRGKCSNSSPE